MPHALSFGFFLIVFALSPKAGAGTCAQPLRKPIQICERDANTNETSYSQLRDVALAAGNSPTLNSYSYASQNKHGIESSGLQGSDKPATIDIELFPQQKFQEIYGFGASVTDSCLELLDGLPPKKRQEFMTKVFDPKKGAGFSYLRIPIGGNDFSSGDYTLNDTPGNKPDPQLKHFKTDRLKKLLDFVKEAKRYNPNIQVMASPWTPPAWMKNTQKVRGGELDSKYFKAYADYLDKAVDAFKSQGVPVRHLTILNEPVIGDAKENWGFPQAYMKPEDQSKFIKQYLAPKLLADKKSKTKILLHDHNYDDVGPLDDFVNDKKAQAVVEGVAYHCYSGDFNSLKRSLSQQPAGLSAFQSECSGTLGVPVTDNFQFWLRNQTVDAIREGTSGALGWNLCLDQNGGPRNNGCQGCRGMVTVDKSGKSPKFEYNSEFQGVAQVSRYVQPGARRIGSSDSSAKGLVNVAFENPDGSHALVVRNATDHAKTFQVRLDECTVETRTVPANGAISLQWSK